MILTVNLSKKYEIVIQKGIFNNIKSEISKVYNGSKIAIITDDNLYGLYGSQLKNSFENAGYTVVAIIIPPGENSKSLNILKDVYSMLSENIIRDDLIVAFGGGVVGDLAGFAASTYMRGVKFIQIPTTLLSQIDSSVGGKTAINLAQGKNMVGSFYHPERVLVDPTMLKTLPKKYFYDGLGEAIKYACIKDENLFNTLYSKDIYNNMEYLIFTCLNIKKEFIEKDEKDQGLRMILNFGHTIGHAIEKHSNYSVSHGEAVCMGMYYITKNSEKLGFTKSGTVEKLTSLFEIYNINYKLDATTEDIVKYIYKDKKNESNLINLILLKEIGSAFIKKVPLKNIYDYVNLG